MQYDVLYQPSFSLLLVRLDAEEELLGAVGATVSMSAGIRLGVRKRVGLLRGLKRALLGSDSFRVDRFLAFEAGEIAFAPPYCGDIAHLHLDGQPLFAQSSAFIAADLGVALDSRWTGSHSFFARDQLVLIKLSGSGDVWVAAYGAIHEKILVSGERHLVDSGYVVAFEGGTEYDVRRSRGVSPSGRRRGRLLVEFGGPGRLWLQTRSPESLLDWLAPHLPASSAGVSE